MTATDEAPQREKRARLISGPGMLLVWLYGVMVVGAVSRSAVQIDRDVEAPAPQPDRGGHVVAQPRQAGATRNDDYLVQVGVVPHDGGGQRLHGVSEMRVRMVPPQCPHQRRREDDVADQPGADEENPHVLAGTNPSPPSPRR